MSSTVMGSAMLPALSMQVPASRLETDCPAPSPVRSIGVAGMSVAMPEFSSVQSNVTVTVPVFQPLRTGACASP